MKAKAPFQLIIVDDNGREMFNTYVANRPESQGVNLSSHAEVGQMLTEIQDALKQPVDKGGSQWYAH